MGEQINLSFADLTGLEGALAGEVLSCAALLAVQATGVSFRGCNMIACLMTDSILDGADFSNAKLPHTDFSRSSLKNANFRKAFLKAADFENCDLSGADFRYAQIEDANFNGANLSGTGLEQ